MTTTTIILGHIRFFYHFSEYLKKLFLKTRTEQSEVTSVTKQIHVQFGFISNPFTERGFTQALPFLSSRWQQSPARVAFTDSSVASAVCVCVLLLLPPLTVHLANVAVVCQPRSARQRPRRNAE